jgi:hypothetical protein
MNSSQPDKELSNDQQCNAPTFTQTAKSKKHAIKLGRFGFAGRKAQLDLSTVFGGFMQ